jgi:hypothetical protein
MFLTALVKALNDFTFQNILKKGHPRREFSRVLLFAVTAGVSKNVSLYWLFVLLPFLVAVSSSMVKSY